MLKRNITYQDFDGNTVTETFYFNFTRAELIELEVEYNDGLEAAIKRIIAANDRKALINEFKKLVLHSYGVKSEDGKRFIKNEKLREEFTQTPAYDSLFMELATNADSAATFVKGIIPKELSEKVDQDKPLAPPAPPTA